MTSTASSKGRPALLQLIGVSTGFFTLVLISISNRRRIRSEISQSGTSSAISSIKTHIKAKRCGCEVNNPQGDCCLGNVRLVVDCRDSLSMSWSSPQLLFNPLELGICPPSTLPYFLKIRHNVARDTSRKYCRPNPGEGEK